MRIAMAERAKEHLAFVGLAVAIGVVEPPDVRNAPGDTAILVGQNPDWDIEPIGEGGDLAGLAVGGEVVEDHDAVAAGLAVGHGERIFEGVGEPQPAAFVEGDIHRLVNVRLRGDQLQFEAGRQMDFGPLLFGRQVRRARDIWRLRRIADANRRGQTNDNDTQDRELAHGGLRRAGWRESACCRSS